MRVLVTGIMGFVGKYLMQHLNAENIEVYGTSRNFFHNHNIYQLDLLDFEKVLSILKEIKPTHVFHLAGMSNVKDSWTNILKTFQVNTIGTINLIEAIKQINKDIRLVTIGSSEEYGIVKNLGKSIDEEIPLNPTSPYGSSKAAVSMLIKQYYKKYRLNVIHIRPFNHIGPGQGLGFVTSDFAYQIALINKGKKDTGINVGNLESIRDFTDVRDIVNAYLLIALKGKAGEVYNVCSGKGVKIKKILDILLSFSEKEIIIKKDSDKYRPSDNPYIVGDYSKLLTLTGWHPTITLNQSLQEIYEYWRAQI